MSLYRNSEGYADVTAGEALSHMMWEYKARQRQRYREKNRRRVYVASPYAGDVAIPPNGNWASFSGLRSSGFAMRCGCSGRNRPVCCRRSKRQRS